MTAETTEIDPKKLKMTKLSKLDCILEKFQSGATTLLVDYQGKLGQCGTTLYCEDENVNVVQGKTEVDIFSSKLFFPSNELFKDVTVGRGFCAALSIDGRVFTWG